MATVINEEFVPNQDPNARPVIEVKMIHGKEIRTPEYQAALMEVLSKNFHQNEQARVARRLNR